MIRLDTNVLVRYLTRDDPEQYRVAKAFIESTCTQENPGFSARSCCASWCECSLARTTP